MNYESQWKKVEELEKKSLPKSAQAEVDVILRQAIADKNSPQMIKSLIHQAKYELVIDGENDVVVFRNLHEMLQNSNDKLEKAVIHSMLGELYSQYYQKDQWTINERTELKGFVPEDMKEWSRNIFFDKIVDHLNASLEEKTLLENALVDSYATVIELGKDSRRFYPTFYDFLARSAISILPQVAPEGDLTRALARKNIATASLFVPADDFVLINFNLGEQDYILWTLETYRKQLKSLQERKMNQSIVLTELERLEYLQKLSNAYDSNALPMLQKMLEKWRSDEISIEISDKIAAIYANNLQKFSNRNNVESEQKLEELYDFLQKEIALFPEYERISILENRLTELTRPLFSVSGNNTFSCKGEKKFTVSYKNIQSVKAQLYKVDSPLEVLKKQSTYRNTSVVKRTFVKEFDVNIPPRATYLSGETEFVIDLTRPGVYMLSFTTNKEALRSGNESDFYFSVSDLTVFSRVISKDKYEFFAVDRTTGEPVRDSKINIYKLPGNWNNSKLTLEKSIPVNDTGLAVYEKDIPNYDLFFHAVSGDDTGSLLTRLPGNYYYTIDTESEKIQEKTNLFTDRSIYRPGQVVYFKGIATRSVDGKTSVVSNKSLEFTLRDANYQEVAKQRLTTNEFGSTKGEFVLPQGLLNGNFNIETENGRIHFRVEEYKRPTFEVTFDKIEQTYKFGDEIVLRGKAENFSGIKLQDAMVNFNIVRRQMWWRFWGGGSEEHFADGMVSTDENGVFEIRFTPEKPDSESFFRQIYTFAIEATVTDLNGETQTGDYSITVGDVSMVLGIDIPDKMERNSETDIHISAKNLDGNDIHAKGNYRIFSLQENDSISKEIVSGEFETGIQPQLKTKLSKLASGKFRIKLFSKDDNGNDIESESDFILYSYSDKRPPVKTNEWLLHKNTTFSKNRNAEVILGVSDKDVNVLYELYQGNNLLERKWIKLNIENRLFSIPYKNDYKEGVTLLLTYVKDEKFYSHNISFTVENENKELNVQLDVFRDKIRPGSEEEWCISVKDASGNPVLSEVLASMYDISLDQIYQTQPWSLNRGIGNRYYSFMRVQQDGSFANQRTSAYFNVPLKQVKGFMYDRFNWFGLNLNYFYGRQLLRGANLSERIVVGFGAPAPKAMADNAVPLEEMVLDVEEDKGSTAGLDGGMKPQIRMNFNETAFFFPQLQTNKEGETLIAFKVPDSNTKWRFRVLAHDKELNSGQTEAITVSQKELMVTPNLPRFLRHGDRTSISTKISNLSEDEVSGEVKIEFFNVLTDETFSSILVENQTQKFSIVKNGSASASWTFDVPSDIDLLGVRIIAESLSFSDGEQHALAVLPNRMLVTESIRMDVNGNQDKNFTFDRLVGQQSDTRENYRLTLEFTSNPVWYAVQALPVLGIPDSDNAVSWFAAYYANSLGAFIGKTYPKVATMIETWKKQGGTKETLLSNLEKNEELKNVLLEETPWVLEAKNESEQKERLSLLFDLNRSRNLTKSALDKLKELQTNRGGWSWFKGFYPSVSITQYILYGFNQLIELNAIANDEEISTMQEEAINYIDTEALNRFEQLKKWNKDWRKIKMISSTDLEYLYVRAAYPQIQASSESKEMIEFYSGVIERNWTGYGLYHRSLIVSLMQKNGKQKIVDAMMKSFREHATVTDEMGMFWSNNRAGVFMSQSAVSVHTFIMDAFRTTNASSAEMDNLKRWLLKQKQTQLWESTHATADAVYALLSTGSDWFASEGETKISLGGKVVDQGKKDAGTGYFKESWSRKEIVPEMGQVEVSHQGNAPAWGALYYQYYEDLDKIDKTDGSLNVEKLLFLEINDVNGKKLVQITKDNPLKTGDKVVVRLTVRTDRDLEFVHLKDMRASCFEPVEQISEIRWMNRVIYYQTTKDASTNFYFDTLPRGTYLFEYPVYVTRKGSYSNGITTIQCMYAPEFNSHTSGVRINVK